MANPSKKKGTHAESHLVKIIEEHTDAHAERRALAGSKDQGDILVTCANDEQLVLEVKAGKQTANYSRTSKEKWLAQTEEEGRNSGLLPYLVIFKYNCPWPNAEVWGDEGSSFWYLDDFLKERISYEDHKGELDCNRSGSR